MDITTVLSVLSDNGFAKRTLQIVTKRVVDGVKQLQSSAHPEYTRQGGINYQKLRKLERLFFGLWQDNINKVPPEVLEYLISYHGKCVGCDRPAFHGVSGQEHHPYCSEECAENNGDGLNENERECGECGRTYDCEYDGGYLDYTDSDVCSSFCAWENLEGPILRWLRQEGYDAGATFAAIKNDVSPWDIYNDRELQRIAVEYRSEE